MLCALHALRRWEELRLIKVDLVKSYRHKYDCFRDDLGNNYYMSRNESNSHDLQRGKYHNPHNGIATEKERLYNDK